MAEWLPALGLLAVLLVSLLPGRHYLWCVFLHTRYHHEVGYGAFWCCKTGCQSMREAEREADREREHVHG